LSLLDYDDSRSGAEGNTEEGARERRDVEVGVEGGLGLRPVFAIPFFFHPVVVQLRAGRQKWSGEAEEDGVEDAKDSATHSYHSR